MARRLKVLARVRLPPVNPYYGLINVFDKSVIVASRDKLVQVGKETVTRVRDTIEKQLYNWVPLSPRYKARKIRKGLDPRILIATGDYLKGMGVRKLADGRIEIGVKDRKHEPSGLHLRVLARIHEYGTRRYRIDLKDGGVAWIKIPPRPHWRPVLAKVKSEIGQTKADLRKIATRRIRAWFKKNRMGNLGTKRQAGG